MAITRDSGVYRIDSRLSALSLSQMTPSNGLSRNDAAIQLQVKRIQ